MPVAGAHTASIVHFTGMIDEYAAVGRKCRMCNNNIQNCIKGSRQGYMMCTRMRKTIKTVFAAALVFLLPFLTACAMNTAESLMIS